jgi:hypothetical protein
MSRTLRARLRALKTEMSTSDQLRRVVRLGAHLSTVVLLLSVPAAAYADTGEPVILAANSLPTVIANLQHG